MMKKVFAKTGRSGLQQVAAALLELAGEYRLMAFYGPMGAGKTTLIKELCAAMRIAGEVSSPTYSLVNEYVLADGGKVFHFDFYRIRSLEEVYDIGYEDYFFSGHLCLIEWPENIQPLLDRERYLKIEIQPEGTERNITITAS